MKRASPKKRIPSRESFPLLERQDLEQARGARNAWHGIRVDETEGGSGGGGPAPGIDR
jgi:hypothetical protein